MGRKNKNYSKTLHQQAYEKLTGMQAFGESKREAMKNGTDQDKIFSFNTYQTYWKHTKYFIKWIQVEHPEVTTLKKARKFAGEWLQLRAEQVPSAWTVQTEAKALGKLFGIRPDDPDYFTPPKRNRAEIQRSRGDRVRDLHFSKTNNDELIKFCRGTGLRRSELEELKGSALVSRAQIDREISQLESLSSRNPAQEKHLGILRDATVFSSEHFAQVKGKGGRVRFAPIIGPHANQIVARIQNTGANEKVWQHVNTSADIHSYRAEYATNLYRSVARPIDQIPYDRVNKGTGKRFQGDVYVCRKDEAGRKLDRAAMRICSKALGHDRVEIFANNYARGL